MARVFARSSVGVGVGVGVSVGVSVGLVLGWGGDGGGDRDSFMPINTYTYVLHAVKYLCAYTHTQMYAHIHVYVYVMYDISLVLCSNAYCLMVL